MDTKKCSKCKLVKSLSDFNIDKSRKLGVTCACKECRHPKALFPKEEFKYCTECKEELEHILFSKCSVNSTGLSSSCKVCQKIKRQEVVKEKVTNTSGYKICTTCKIEKTINLFYIDNNNKDLLSSACKFCKKEYYNNTSEKIKKRNKSFYDENYHIIKERRKYLESINEDKQKLKYEKASKRELISKLKIVKRKIKNLIGSSFKRACNGGYIKSKRTEEILGCAPIKFKNHIESQFLPWMSWENHGNCEMNDYNCSWDLDHIIPVSWARTEDEIYLLNHWSNFQPLCSKVNREDKKSNVPILTNLELKITIN